MAEVMHVHRDFTDLVFEKRNKSYGAYSLRRGYTLVVFICLLIAVVFIGTVVAVPYIAAFIKSLKPQEEVIVPKSTEVTLTNPPPIDENEPPPPPPASTAPPPMQESVKFTVPIVTEEVVNEDVAVTEELVVSNPGTVTQEGVEGFLSPVSDDGGGNVIGETKDEIFTIVEKMPEFPGGEEALMNYLSKNIKYPQTAKELGIQGTVYVSFVVDQYGNINNVKLLRGIGGGCDEEAVRVVEKMPRWNPGKQGGRPVKVEYRLPIRFRLS
jgi:protein TonB